MCHFQWFNAGIFRVAVEVARVFPSKAVSIAAIVIGLTAFTPYTTHIHHTYINNGLTRWSPRSIVCSHIHWTRRPADLGPFRTIDLQILLHLQLYIIDKSPYTASLLSSSHLSPAFTRHSSLLLMLSPMLLDTGRLD
jgi:hypothetical protein